MLYTQLLAALHVNDCTNSLDLPLDNAGHTIVIISNWLHDALHARDGTALLELQLDNV